MPNQPRIEQDGRAWYRPSTDTVGIPSRNAFDSADGYYATLFHELVHSTGHTSRIGRDGIERLNTFGSESYSKEELVAEMGSAMLCGITGIAPATIENSASYLRSWIDVLRGDSKLIICRIGRAERSRLHPGGALVIVTKLDSPDVQRPSREFLLIPQNDVETELLKALYIETTLTCFMHKTGLRIYIAKLEAA